MELLRSLFEWVDAFPTSIAIRESQYLYPAILTSHTISMAMFAGLMVAMDLRLVGMAYRRTTFSHVQQRLFPWQMVMFTLSAITGLVLVYTQPMRFYGNFFFWLKASMIALAGVNAMAFHVGTYQSILRWDTDAARIPFGAKLAGAVSLAMWAGVVLAGRLIAYNWFQG